MSLQTKLFQARVRGGYIARQAPVLARFFVSCAAEYMKDGGKLDEAALVKLTDSLLDRPLSQEEKEYFLDVVGDKRLSKWALPFSFFRLPNRIEKKLMGEYALVFHHRARRHLVKEILPAARKILDIGGAVDIHPEGALPGLGYPHRPLELHIVDLPDHLRIHKRGKEPLRDLETSDGIKTKYTYSGMTDLSAFANDSFDLVWSGQSIEHVSEEDGEKTLREVYRVLKPGGFFCLDTPNRTATRLISTEYLHPEHKLEYTPDQLCEKLETAGFIVEEKKGITPVPISVRVGRLSKLEIMNEVKVTDDYQNGFSFYVKCRKPALNS